MVASKDRETGDGAGARGRAAEAYQAARERTFSAYEAARDRAADVGRQAAVYPIGAVIGGLAAGALIGLLLPRSRREAELLAPTGRRITEAARDAAQRGVDAGKQQIEEIRDRAAKKVGEAVVEAVGGGGKE
jgi:hypothetical protein